MPASSQAIKAGRAFVELFTENSPLERGLKRAERSFQQWGQRVQAAGLKIFAAGAGLGAGLFGATKAFAAAGDEIDKMSARTGASAEFLSQMGFAAEQSGASLGSVEKGLRGMQRFLFDAERGLATQTEALDKLGISYQDLAGLSPEEQFMRITEGIAALPTATERAGAAMKVFGRAGTELLPMLGSIDELRAEADALGLTISGDTAKQAAVLTDAMNRLWRTVKMTVFWVGSALAPVVTSISDLLAGSAKRVADFVKQNRGLVIAAAGVSVTLLTVGGTLIGLGIALKLAALGFSGLAAAIGLVKAALALLFSPIGLVVAAVAGIVAGVLHLTGTLGTVKGVIAGFFGDLADDARKAFGAIGQALAAGDIKAAARVLWAFLKLEFQRGINALNEFWLPAAKFFTDVWNAAVSTASAALINVWAGLETAWVQTVDFFKDVWDGFVGFMIDAFGKPLAKMLGLMTELTARAKGASKEFASLAGAGVEQAVLNELSGEADRRDAEITAREQERARRLAEIDKDRQQALAENERILQDKFDASQRAQEQKMQQAAEDLKRAQQELEEATSAVDRRKSNAAGGPGEAGGLDLGGLSESGQSAIRGTFSAFRLGGLAAPKAAEQTAANTKKMVQQLANLNSLEEDKRRRGGLVFG